MEATDFIDLLEQYYDGEWYSFGEEDKTTDGQSYEEFLNQHNIQFIENNDVEQYTSYGHEDSLLERIFLHVPSGKYFMMYGTRQSYDGTEWDGIKEVQKVEKIITVWQ